MGTEFFDELGETITRTAKEIGGRAEQFYEAQKLRNKISGETRIIEKVMTDLGNMIYKRYASGEELDEEQKALCNQIDQHKEQIAKYREALADMRGKKICPSCQAAIDRDSSFCPKCGTSVPNPEPEEEEGDVVEEETAEAPEETPAEETPAEEAPAEETPAEETPAEEAPAEETPAEEASEEKQ